MKGGVFREAKVHEFEGDAEPGHDRAEGNEASLGCLAFAAAALGATEESGQYRHVGDGDIGAIGPQDT